LSALAIVTLPPLACGESLQPAPHVEKCIVQHLGMLPRSSLTQTALCTPSPPIFDAAMQPVIAAIRAERSNLKAETSLCGQSTISWGQHKGSISEVFLNGPYGKLASVGNIAGDAADV
jgi:hypothetical protein